MMDRETLKRAHVLIGLEPGTLEPRPDNQANVPGYVYLIRDEPRGLVKIGKTRDLSRRLLELRRQYDTDCFVIVHAWMTDDPDWLERYFHAQLKHHRKGGEWFHWDAVTELPTDAAVIWLRDPSMETRTYEPRYSMADVARLLDDPEHRDAGRD